MDENKEDIRLGHTFEVKQSAPTIYDLVLLDGKTLLCKKFDLMCEVGEPTILKAEIYIHEVNVEIAGKKMHYKNFQVEENEIPDCHITFG